MRHYLDPFSDPVFGQEADQTGIRQLRRSTLPALSQPAPRKSLSKKLTSVPWEKCFLVDEAFQWVVTPTCPTNLSRSLSPISPISLAPPMQSCERRSLCLDLTRCVSSTQGLPHDYEPRVMVLITLLLLFRRESIGNRFKILMEGSRESSRLGAAFYFATIFKCLAATHQMQLAR